MPTVISSGGSFQALIEPVVKAPTDFKYTQVVFNLISVQVWGALEMPDKMPYICPMYHKCWKCCPKIRILFKIIGIV